ncbi:DUF4176 domain-containing protein [Bacillus nitratireducens]|uniref:DUF4176 domain-containing protein n=1 Tax=Bacillus nitratireducens TaxID=2026193 RepID=UPI0034663F56
MKLLPIGTVVKLEGVEPIIMIIGRMIVSADKHDFDYVGVPYPVGYLGDEKGFWCKKFKTLASNLLNLDILIV